MKTIEWKKFEPIVDKIIHTIGVVLGVLILALFAMFWLGSLVETRVASIPDLVIMLLTAFFLWQYELYFEIVNSFSDPLPEKVGQFIKIAFLILLVVGVMKSFWPLLNILSYYSADCSIDDCFGRYFH